MASIKAQRALAPKYMTGDGDGVFETDKVVLGAAPGLGTPAAADTIDFRIPAGAQLCNLKLQLDDCDTGTAFVFGVGYRAVDTGSSLATNATYFAAAGQTTGTVSASLSTTHQMARSVFLGAQALAIVSGANQTSEETYSLLENRTNFQRNLELAGEIMGSEEKLRWALPNSAGDLEMTDFGVMVIDSVVKRRNV